MYGPVLLREFLAISLQVALPTRRLLQAPGEGRRHRRDARRSVMPNGLSKTLSAGECKQVLPRQRMLYPTPFQGPDGQKRETPGELVARPL